jgi:putative two-component system response regulator
MANELITPTRIGLLEPDPSGRAEETDGPDTDWTLPSDGTAQPKVLIVDDEPLMIQVVAEHLRQAGYRNLVSTDQSSRAIGLIIAEQPDVILLDIQMPVINGLDILDEVAGCQTTAGIPVIVLTASTDDDLKLKALRLGATDFLQKPVHGGELVARLRNILMAKAYQDHLRDQSHVLETAVRQRTAALEASPRELIHCLARAAEFRDDDTGQHIIRVGRYARIIGDELGMSRREVDVLDLAAQLHDVGKIGIPDAILHKPGKLTPSEFEIMQEHCHFGEKIIAEKQPDAPAPQLNAHTEIGARLLAAGKSPILEVAVRIALTHHERWDGSGYPAGLKGEEIPLEGRITAVADVFDALSSKRPYKPAFTLEKCLRLLEEGRGTHFDPRVLDAFLARREQIVEIQTCYADPVRAE